MAWPIAGDIRRSVTELFPVRRDRMVVLGLVALAAIVSTTELVATQLFSVIILPKSDRNTAVTALLVVLFLVFFGGLRVINFFREKYRINVFERALVDSGVSKVSDSWRWAMAMEVTQILSTVSRIAVVVAACVVLAPLFGAAVVVAVAAVGCALSFLYRRQLSTQREFRAAQLAYRSVDNATKVRTRVIAGETGALFGYAGVVVLIGLVAVVAFEPLFLLFHYAFFPQGNFLFDPATSNLIRLYPDWYWEGITLRVGASFVALALALAAVSALQVARGSAIDSPR